MKVDGKTVVVTGAGNGVGRAVTLEALRRGARVAGVDISQDGLDETARLAADPDRLSLHRVDITDPAAVAALPGEVIARHGSVDGLIHLAAIDRCRYSSISRNLSARRFIATGFSSK